MLFIRNAATFAGSGATCHGHCSAFLSPRTSRVSYCRLQQFCSVRQLQGTMAFPGEDLVLLPLPCISPRFAYKSGSPKANHISKKKCVQRLPKTEYDCKIGPISVQPVFVAKRRGYAAAMCCCCFASGLVMSCSFLCCRLLLLLLLLLPALLLMLFFRFL